MKQATQNTFNEGMVKDLNPLTTPNNVLTDAVNGTLITYNGNEFVLQNDMGNCKVERAKLSTGFIPVGMKEYGGIIYVVSYNPETKDCEIGSFPSPERDFTTDDFENLAPANFSNTDFIVNTGQSNVTEKTSVITKLVEPELLQLNPGDMFVVTYDIKDPGEPSGSDVIDSKIKMDEFITSDVLDRKLFKLKFYKISDDNNLNEIDPDDIKLIDNNDDPEGQYIYFKEKNQGVVAVGLELETLDEFEINVVDTSRRTQALKSAVIEAIGYSDSLADFQGVKVDITSPQQETFYIEKTANVKKVSAVIDQLQPQSKLIGTITPYSDYALYGKLKKDFNLELGKYLSPGAGVNNIFKYKVTNNLLRLDFDYRFQGSNDNGLVLYVEFYDPWSDYSVVKVVDNPTYYGNNTVQLELVDEPAIDVFDSTTTGGTLNINLVTNPDTTYQKTMLNSTNLIRTTSTLRKNHFYIVRISGIDVDYSTPTPAYTHYDLYKGLYTNDLLNDLYELQNSISINDPSYTPDFNTVDFKIQDLVKYDSVVRDNIPTYVQSPLINLEDGGTNIDNKYYRVQETITSGGNFKSGYTYTRTVNTDVDLTMSGNEYIFGTLKPNVTDIEFPNLDPEQGPVDPSLIPVVEDVGYNTAQTSINPNSEAKIELTEVTPLNYRLKKSLVSSRWVFADKMRYEAPDGQNVRRIIRNNIPVEHRFTGIDHEGFYFTGKNVYLNGGLVKISCKDDKFKHDIALQIINGHYSNKPVIIYARGVADEIRTSNYDGCKYNTYAGGRYMVLRFDDGAIWDGQTWALIRRDNGYYPTLIGTNNRATLKEAAKAFRVHSAVEKVVYVYFPDEDKLVHNNSVTTNALFDNLYYTVNYNRIGGVKTYLSTFRFKALNSIQDFSTQVLNDYITSRKGSSIIVDNSDSLNDGFIPYIDSDLSNNVFIDVSDLSITEAASSALVTAFLDAENTWNSDPMFSTDNRYRHGQLYSLNPAYNSLLKLFNVAGVTENVEITESNVELYGESGNQTPGGWKGVRNGEVKGDERNYTVRLNLRADI